MISAITGTPVIAAPIAAPRIACSEIGVSRTRSGPNSSTRPDRRLEHAARRRDVLAEHHEARVPPHLLGDPVGDGLPVGQFRHRDPPSAYTSVSSDDSPGSAPALANSVAASIRSATSSSIASSSSSATPSVSSRAR